MKLVVTIPALNEEATIARVVRQIPREIPGISRVEIIVVNDASTDRTAQLARDAGASVITIRGRQGLGHVFRAEMEHAIRRGADLMVNIDGDGQFDSRDIARLIRPLLDGQADFVTCSRFGNSHYQPVMCWQKWWGNRAVTWMINRLCGTRLTDASCGFRAYNREAAYRLTQFGSCTYVEECLLDFSTKGIRMVELPLIVRGEREFGTSRVAASVVRYGLHLLQILLRAGRDVWPMEVFGTLAALVGIPGALVAGWLTLRLIFTGTTAPYTGLLPVAHVMMIVGVLMFAVALLADMVRGHRNVSEELLYLARRRIHGRANGAPAARQIEPAATIEAPANARSAAETTAEVSISATHIGGLHITDG